MPAEFGEKVSEDTDIVERLNSDWKVSTDVYYTGSHYNVYCRIRETNVGFFSSADGYSKVVRADDKDEIEDEAKKVIELLFDTAEEREDARDLSIDVSVD
jgi:hypothetical protein